MARKARLTVFSRFLIMMLVVGPLAFIGASYYNGEDGVQNIKDLFNSGKERVTQTRTNRTDATIKDEKLTAKIRKLEDELEDKQSRLEKLYNENEKLKDKLDKCEQQSTGG